MSIFREESGFLRDWALVAGMLVGFSVLMLVAVLVADYHSKYQCDNFEEVTGRKSEWIFMDACYVESKDGEMIRYDKAYKE